MILECLNANEIPCRRHISAYTCRAVRFTVHCDLGRFPSHRFQLGQVRSVLALIIADMIIERGIDCQLSDLQRDLLIRIPEHTGPGTVVPVSHAPFLSGLVPGLAARISAVLI